MSNQIMNLKPGALLESRNGTWTVAGTCSLDAVSLLSLSTGERKVCTLAEVARLFYEQEKTLPRDDRVISPTNLGTAAERLALLTPLRDPACRTRSLINEIAKKAGVHISTVYRWLVTFDLTYSALDLVPQTPTGGRGKSRLPIAVEHKINELLSIEVERKPLARWDEIVQIVRASVRGMGASPPHKNTIRKRWVQHRGSRRPSRGRVAWPDHYEAEWPLEVVQIDHTRVNARIVDDDFRLDLERPWITIAIDVFSRMVLGFFLSDAPSAASVGMCLLRSILPKDKWLEEIGVNADWPCRGLMTMIHADNAKDFRGNMLKQVCLDYGMDLQWRVVKTPQYGGHIERYGGTLTQFFNSIPGTTFSNVAQRDDYDSAKEACFTYRELEAMIADEIGNHYHIHKHGGLNEQTPIQRYRLGILGTDDRLGTGLPLVPLDDRKLRIDLSPLIYRTIQKTGVQIDWIRYYDPVLDPFIQAGKRGTKYLFHRIPDCISPIYFFNPHDKQYYDIPYRNLTRDVISLWELRKSRKDLERDEMSVTEDRLFEYHMRRRRKEDEAQEMTRTARLAISKRPEKRERSGRLTLPPAAQNPRTSVLEDETDYEPFEGLEES